jgi:hypothetical protein
MARQRTKITNKKVLNNLIIREENNINEINDKIESLENIEYIKIERKNKKIYEDELKWYQDCLKELT